MSLHSPSVLVTPPMRAIQALGDKDKTLEALMADYIRASELQLSLKRRIEAEMREKEERAKQEEEIAMAALRAAEQKMVQLREANRILKERMRKAAGIKDDERTVPTSARSIPVELPQSRIRAPRAESPRPYSPCIPPPSPLRPLLRPTTPVFVMPNPAPAAGPFNSLEVMKEVTNIDDTKKKKKGKGKKGKCADSLVSAEPVGSVGSVEPARPVSAKFLEKFRQVVEYLDHDPEPAHEVYPIQEFDSPHHYFDPPPDFDSPHDLYPRQELNPVDDFYPIQAPPTLGFGRYA
ncbi:hypothetical protein FRC18_012173 [Serendipita sp. 400]|nr:hypothetical protein FRC18_012173 [Serendipita sp. 400]